MCSSLRGRVRNRDFPGARTARLQPARVPRTVQGCNPVHPGASVGLCGGLVLTPFSGPRRLAVHHDGPDRIAWKLVPVFRTSISRRPAPIPTWNLLPLCRRMPPNSAKLAGRRPEKSARESPTYVWRFRLSLCENWLLNYWFGLKRRLAFKSFSSTERAPSHLQSTPGCREYPRK